jgi:hypothetical protein
MRSHTASDEAMRPRSKFYIFESLVIAPIVLRISHRNALFNGELPALFICATPLVLLSR